ncbi:MAG: hypothetical protein J6A04_03605 [Clostridia bacterium]|nr:hypothetical protein [Clostridia bacterium]
MEEKKNEEQNVNTEEIKKETVETVNQVKETIKNVDIKNDAKEATGFVSSMFKDPFGTIKQIVSDSSNKYFKIAIIFAIVWMAVILVDKLFGVSFTRFSFNLAFKQILSIVKAVIAPVLGIVVLSGIIYFMNKENKKSIITIITAIVTAKIPVIIASVVSLLTIIDSKVSLVTSPFASLCSVISIVLTYFATKTIFGEEQNSKFFKKFVIIEAIYYAAYIIVSLLGIYMR